MAACIFCRIIKGEIPSFKLFESDKVFAFLDIQPLSRGHALVIPKYHGAKLTDIPDDHLTEILYLAGYTPPPPGPSPLNASPVSIQIHDFANGRLYWGELTDDDEQPVAKKIAQVTGATDFNVLQNNGRIAHQVVDHVHFHMIPKPNEEEGLGIGWPAQAADMDKLKEYYESIKAKI
ncbi:HIT-like domain-containing protein [Aspergillus nidulans var. acristatus]